ncbi:MAG: type II toxin-antitoxin system RelE/ParE family toxin [Rhizobiales bacterium]|nr:type II toxin-antitoxin system RelE/ParE family toxin [Hyphomicrobiales bacterium]
MAGYVFYSSSDSKLDEIWQYSEDTHGTRQAEKYMLGLHAYLQNLSENKKIWKKLPKNLTVSDDLDVQLYFNKYEYHFIYFREFPSGKIGIMSILHETMDIPVRLKEDLGKINDGNL